MNGKEKKLIKIVLLGETNVGKTTIFQRFIESKISDVPTATIGVEFKIKEYKYNNKNYSIQIFDTAGQERFRSITEAYYKMGEGFFVVFDLTNIDSLNAVKYWIESIQVKTNEHSIIIVGNKDDIKEQIPDNVINNTLENFKNIKYIKTSALQNKNITKAFEEMINLLEKSKIYLLLN